MPDVSQPKIILHHRLLLSEIGCTNPKHQIDELKDKAQRDPKQDGSADVIVQDTK